MSGSISKLTSHWLYYSESDVQVGWLAVTDSSGIQSSIRSGYSKKKKKRQEKTFKINIFDDDDSISLLLAKITVI
jgi:hypothetical protein